jgi:hypothetical protein
VLARPIQFSKNRPASGSFGASARPEFTRIRLNSGEPSYTTTAVSGCQRHPTFLASASQLGRPMAWPGSEKRQSQSGRRCGLGGTFSPAVRLGSPATRELGDYERRRRKSILRAEERLVNPAPPARNYPRRDCLTYGRPTSRRCLEEYWMQENLSSGSGQAPVNRLSIQRQIGFG